MKVTPEMEMGVRVPSTMWNFAAINQKRYICPSFDRLEGYLIVFRKHDNGGLDSQNLPTGGRHC